MEFREKPAIAAFRQEVRNWIDNDLTDDERAVDARGNTSDESYGRILSVRKKLSNKGWAAPAWPKEYGGMGATVRHRV